jgi:hypothetical protein
MSQPHYRDRKRLHLSEAEKKVLGSVLSQTPARIELSVADLNIDYSYQDRPREGIVSAIAADFNPALLGEFKISQRRRRRQLAFSQRAGGLDGPHSLIWTASILRPQLYPQCTWRRRRGSNACLSN